MDLEQLTGHLAGLYQSGRKYRCIQQTHQVLAQLAHAPELVLLALRGLIDLELGGPARELIQLRSELSDHHADFAQLKSAAAALPNGRVPWRERTAAFRANLEALLDRRSYLRETVEALPPTPADLHLYQIRDGQFQLSRRRPGQLREWLPSLTAEPEEADLELPPRGRLGPVAVIGLRIGPVLERVYQDTHRLLLSYGHPLFILEPDPARFAAWLHCADPRPLLHDDRVYFFIGGDAVARLTELLAADPDLPLPVVYVNQSETEHGAAMAAQVSATVEQVARQRRAELDRCLDEIQRRYSGRDAAYCSELMGPPGRVLGLTSRFTTVLQYSMRDALHALDRMGYEPHVLLETDDHHQLSQVTICRKLLELDPVMVLLLDHLRYEFPHLPDNLPLLTWIQDPLPNLLCRRAGESIGPLDYVCGYLEKRDLAEFGYPQEAFTYTGIPVSTHVFHDGELDAPTRAEYACDICFVSNTSEPLDRFYRSALAAHPPALRPLLEHIYRRALAVIAEAVFPPIAATAGELVQSSAAAIGLTLPETQKRNLNSFFAYRLLDWGRRQQTLEWVADWARRTGRVFKVYGRGWEDHPTLREFAAGVVEHGEPLRRAYRAARLALQLVPGGFRHQRSYELLASGCLPLSRYAHEEFDGMTLEEFVQRREAGEPPGAVAALFPGLERVVFRTPAEFEALAERFLGHEVYRQQVLSELREVVLGEHTYDAVMRKVMTAFRDRLRAAAFMPRGLRTAEA